MNNIKNECINDFYIWLNQNIEYKYDELLQLSDICEIFLGKKVGPRIMTKYKKEIENWIKEKYKQLNHKYQKCSINEHNYRGWMHLTIKS